MEIIASPVVTDGHVEGSARLHHRHEQAFGERPGPRSLLDDLPLMDDSKGLLPPDPSLVGAEECMIPPLDASGPSCGLNGVKSEHSNARELFNSEEASFSIRSRGDGVNGSGSGWKGRQEGAV